MNTAILDPRIFEFETEEKASSYDKWFCAKAVDSVVLGPGVKLAAVANTRRALSSEGVIRRLADS